MYWGLPRSRRNIKRLDTSPRKTRYHAPHRGWTLDRTEGATGGRQTSIPPVVVAKRRAATPEGYPGRYRLSAQRQHGTRSYSTTSPSRSCSDSTTKPRNTQPSMQAWGRSRQAEWASTVSASWSWRCTLGVSISPPYGPGSGGLQHRRGHLFMTPIFSHILVDLSTKSR